MEEKNILQHIKTENIDFSLYDSVTSTNDLLKQEVLNGAREGRIIAALSQTKGRGRKGKTFISNKGGMYLSILVKPEKLDFDTTLITSASAVAVCKAIEEITNQKTSIKWVNDVLIGNKKVCGILCESLICGKESFVIVGIGLNFYCSEFYKEIREVAGCIFKTSEISNFEVLTAKIIDNFFEIYNSSDFLEDYIKRSIVLNKEIFVIKNGEKVSAFALALDNKCRLKVKYPNNKEEMLSSGEISIKIKEL